MVLNPPTPLAKGSGGAHDLGQPPGTPLPAQARTLYSVNSETQNLDTLVSQALERFELRDRSRMESRQDLVKAALDELGTYLEKLLVTRDVTEQRRDQRAFLDAHRRLAARADVLQHQVDNQRVTEERLRQSEERHRQLSAHLHASIEDERARIAREVHDELGAALTAIRFELVALRGQAERDPVVRQAAAAVISRVDAAIQSTRRICSDLRPSLLDHMGLWPAIEWLVEDVATRAGIRATVDVTEGREMQDPARVTAIFRIVQEALTNVVRHAGASTVRVTAQAHGEGMAVEVADDGCGIPEAELTRPDAFGIIGMQERARICGGDVAVERGTQGTCVKLRVPLGAGDSCAS